MTTQIKRRRGTTTEHSTFTGAEGELTIDTTKDTVVVHDGSTAGGHPLAKESSIAGKVDTSGDTMTGDLTVPNLIVSGNVDGRDVSADGTKLDGIEAGADVTDTANVSAAGAAMETGAAFTGNVTFGDNDKAIFGAGSDLQIYHNNNQSFISESGSGSLFINASDLVLRNTSGEYFFYGNSDGSVILYHDNASKLATTSTGIDVTGTVTADGLTVDGNANVDGSLTFTNQGVVNAYINSQEGFYFNVDSNNDQSTERVIQFGANAADSSGKKIALFQEGGDISFYEDTGTTPKFFWDASAESLGIGTTLPSYGIDSRVNKGSNPDWGYNIANFVDGQTNNSGLRIASNVSTDGIVNLLSATNSAASQFAFWTYNGSSWGERMRILSDGNVAINHTSASSRLTVGAPDSGDTLSLLSLFANSGATGGSASSMEIVASSNKMKIKLGGSDQLVIGNSTSDFATFDASGNLLVGTTDADPNNNSTNTSADDGFAVTSNVLRVAKYNDNAAVFNRTGTDGGIVSFRKSGTTVGSIGTQGGDKLIIGNGDVGVAFNPNADSIYPWNTATNAAHDAGVDLGYSDGGSTNIRFRNLYLSGGVFLGGAGASNKLDDYEEGTHEVTFTTQTSGTITMSPTANLIRYTKVGNTVSVQGRVIVASVSSPVGYISISLPFAIAAGAEQSSFTALNCWTHAVNLASNSMGLFLEGSGGLASVIPYQMRNNLSWVDLPSANLVGGGNEVFYIVGTYMTDS